MTGRHASPFDVSLCCGNVNRGVAVAEGVGEVHGRAEGGAGVHPRPHGGEPMMNLDAVLAAAARVGVTRLIDNVVVSLRGMSG